jgi:hypothetical protein
VVDDVSLVQDDAATAGTAQRRTYALEIFLVSFAALLLEVSYTRVVSFKFFYYYTYFVIGLALLGIGCGGVLVTVSGRLRRASTGTIVMWSMLLGAASVGVGYVVVAYTSPNTLDLWHYGTSASAKSFVLLLVICLALFASFIVPGVVIATLFSRRPERVGRLYFADLIGAGVAAALVVLFISTIGPPATIFLAALVMAVGGLHTAARLRSPLALVAVALAALAALAVVLPTHLPYQRLDASKGKLTPKNTTYTKWSPIFRVDTVNSSPDYTLLYHDGLIGSVIYRWNGEQASLGQLGFATDPRSLPFDLHGTPPANVGIIGAAGGHEVLTSLYYNAGHVDAVELNPVTYNLVTTRLANYDGHLAQNPKVNYVEGDGRSFLARNNQKYDLIWYPAPDSYSATNASTASAFVLSESYLYTTNAIVDSINHLGPNGILAAQFGELDFAHKPNRTTRYVATVRQALTQLGNRDPGSHVLVATSTSVLPGVALPSTVSTILVKATPFTPSDVSGLLSGLTRVPGSAVQYAPGRTYAPGPVSAAITTPNPATFDASYPYDVRAISDNRPFFWHFASFGKVISNYTHSINGIDPEDQIGERVLLLLLGIAILLAGVFLLLPFVAIRERWVGLPRKGRSAIFFSAIGLGFFFFEITLIQRLVLFLGYPTYSLTVTLASLLVFTGIGAFLTGQPRDASTGRLLVLLGAIVGLSIFYLFGLPPMTSALQSLPMAARVLISFAVLAPLGLCLGRFMPLGLAAVGKLTEFRREYVAWGWAVNGFASVIGSVLATILAMTYGFGIVLALAVALYVIAVIALRGLVRSPKAPSDAEPSGGGEAGRELVGLSD